MLATQPDVARRMYSLLRSEASRVAPSSDVLAKRLAEPEWAVAYMYVLATAGVLDVAHKPRGLFAKLSTQLRDTGTTYQFTEAETEELLKTMAARQVDSQNPIFPAGSPAQTLAYRASIMKNRPLLAAMRKTGRILNKATAWYNKIPTERLDETGVPALVALGRHLQRQAAELGQLKLAGYYERATNSYQVFAHYAGEITDSLTPFQRKALGDFMYARSVDKTLAPPNDLREAVGKLDNLFQRLWQFERYNGLEVEQRQKYWPVMLDNEYIAKNIDRIVPMVLATPELQRGWEDIRGQYIEWVRNAGAGPNHTLTPQLQAIVSGLATAPLENFVKLYLEQSKLHDLPGWNLEERKIPGTDMPTGHTPGFRFMNRRVLDFLLPYAGRQEWEGFFVKDPGHVLPRYIKQAAKRSEWNRMEQDLPGGIAGTLQLAKDQGATPAQIQLAVDTLDAVTGTLGLRQRDALDAVIRSQGPDSPLKMFDSGGRSVMNEKLNLARSALMFWQVITKLTLTALTGTVDFLGQLVLHNNWKIFQKSMRDTYKNLYKINRENPDSRWRMLNMVGVMENAFTRDDLEGSYYGPDISPWIQRQMTTFFRWTGVEWAADRAREVAGYGAEQALLEWKFTASDPNQPVEKRNTALDRLAEFGVTPDDLTAYTDSSGLQRLLVRNLEQRGDPGSPEWLRDDKVRIAIMRFVDQSQVRPDPLRRTLSASNPYFAIFLQWKSFLVTFDAQILKPMWNKLTEEGNASPMLWMVLTFVPTMLFADMLRDVIKTAGDDDDDNWRPDWKDDWTLGQHIAYAVERSGLYGRQELLLDIMQPLMAGKVPEAIAELAGPTAGDVRKLISYGPSSLNLPLGDATKHWDIL